MLEQVLEKYPTEVKIVFKNFPLRNHKFATKAAIAALAAHSQKKFWEFHDLLFENFDKLDDQRIDAIAKSIGLDEEKYKKKLKDPTLKRRIIRDISEGRRVGVRNVPTVFINGRLLRDLSLKGFQIAVNRELKTPGKKVSKEVH